MNASNRKSLKNKHAIKWLEIPNRRNKSFMVRDNVLKYMKIIADL